GEPGRAGTHQRLVPAQHLLPGHEVHALRRPDASLPDGAGAEAVKGRAIMRPLLLVVVLCLALAEPAGAQTALELFPQDAAAAVAIRDLDDLIKKGDEFLQLAELRLPIRPSQLFDMGAAFLGVNQGMHRRAPAALVLMSPTDPREFKDLEF